jgi:hypothetical protein
VVSENAVSLPQELTVVCAGSNWGHRFIPDERFVYIAIPRWGKPQEWQHRRIVGFLGEPIEQNRLIGQ